MPSTLPRVILLGLGSSLLFASVLYIPALGMIASLVSSAPMIIAGFLYGPTAVLWAAGAGILWLLMAVPTPFVGAFVIMDCLPAILVVWAAWSGPRLTGAGRGHGPGQGITGSLGGSNPADPPSPPLPAQNATAPTPPVGIIPVGRILSSLGVVGFIIIGMVAMAASGSGTISLQQQVMNQIAEIEKLVQTALDLGTGEVSIPYGAWLPAATVAMWIARALFAGWVAAYWLKRKGTLPLAVPPIDQIVLPGWYAGLFLGVGIGALLASGDAGYMAGNAVIVLSVPLFVMGLLAAHMAARTVAARKPLLVSFYVTLMLVSPLGKAAVVALGLVEVMLRRNGSGDRPNETPPRTTEG